MMMRTTRCLLAALAPLLLAVGTGVARADEAALRKGLAQRLPDLPRIDEVTRTPVPGLYEVRYNGTEILYSNETGDYIIVNGSLVETRTRQNLTEARTQKLMVKDFDRLPLSDAIVIRQGTGARRMAIFVDPNCEYCKNFEQDLVGVRDLTIYAFLIPILGPDSKVKARDIWCSKDAARAWRDWMLEHQAPVRAMKCDASALDRNLTFASQQRITVTPSLFFADGTRKPGVLAADALENRLVAAATAPVTK
jgi:thiol:disulfide interchange protein DsbC